ncbi:RHS repeat-associated core domain-containing protein [Pseudomonas fluorescens]|uniref:RHS repeat-associated core domain-containing protein n=1 Tax=Pseudomonas fluorescens TaxID=294 RepID=A0A5E6ZU93_PSEFL|nr:RHS repeat-associated core domain-containing protein [Pseudomonas fluorescens]VVN68254.1 hypothetical protein PS833_00236 [Pseudomonas fluorescens]
MQLQPTTLLCRYGYDPLDRLTSHTLSETPVRQRFYCKSRLTTEIQGAMKYSIIQLSDLLLAQQHVEGEALDTTLLATDQQRSVLQTLKSNPPDQAISYSPYGHRPADNGLLSLLGFNGERPDQVTGHYLLGNGYRAFNPVLMRFNSPDSFSPFGNGGVNSYAYCLGDPINLHDPSGNFALPKALSNVFNKLLSAMGARRKIYMSGPEVVRTRMMSGPETVSSSSRHNSDSFEVNANGIKSIDSTMTWINGKITGATQDTIYHDNTIKTLSGKFVKGDRSLSLQELAYSNVTGAELQSQYRNHKLLEINPLIDLINYKNAHGRSYSNPHYFTPRKQVDHMARTGELLGVRPSEAKKIIRQKQ